MNNSIEFNRCLIKIAQRLNPGVTIYSWYQYYYEKDEDWEPIGIKCMICHRSLSTSKYTPSYADTVYIYNHGMNHYSKLKAFL